jgi:hypothetical protein
MLEVVVVLHTVLGRLVLVGRVEVVIVGHHQAQLEYRELQI